MAREMSELGKWFENNDLRYNPWKGCSIDSFVCHEIGDYIGGYENSVEDGYYDRFPLHRKDAVDYAYKLYMDYLPKGVRYQGKEYYQAMAEKVVKGCEEAWGIPDWCPEGQEAICYDELEA